MFFFCVLKVTKCVSAARLRLGVGGVSGGERLQLDHQVPGSVVSAELHGPRDHRRPAVWERKRRKKSRPEFQISRQGLTHSALVSNSLRECSFFVTNSSDFVFCMYFIFVYPIFTVALVVW